jgi:hypothetical protein
VVDEIAACLTAMGEAFEVGGPDEPGLLRLRALPVVLRRTEDALSAEIGLTPSVSITRLLALIYDLALQLGGEVSLDGATPTERAAAWLCFADDQDRLRIGRALDRAEGRADEVLRGLWDILVVLGSGRDLRWHPRASRIVEVDRGELGLEDEPTLSEEEVMDPMLTVRDPAPGTHILAWRWLTEAWPALAEG